MKNGDATVCVSTRSLATTPAPPAVAADAADDVRRRGVAAVVEAARGSARGCAARTAPARNPASIPVTTLPGVLVAGPAAERRDTTTRSPTRRSCPSASRPAR